MAAIGFEVPVVISPILTIRPRTVALDIADYSGVILTSENGLHALAELCNAAGLTAWCVGDQTADAARSLGMTARSAGGDARDLIALISGAEPTGRLLYARGAETRGDVAGALAAVGIDIDPVIVYDQVAMPLTAEARRVLETDASVVLPLFSPRSAALLSEAAVGSPAQLQIVALSKAVAAAWSGPAPEAMRIAAHPDATQMAAEVATIYSALSA